jgi:hypothetical protein
VPLTSLPDGESRVSDIREITTTEANALWEMGVPVMYKCSSWAGTNNPDHLVWTPWRTNDSSPQEDEEWATAHGAVVYQWGTATE